MTVPSPGYRLTELGDEEQPRSVVERQDNRIYFYADVTSEKAYALLRLLRDVDADLAAEAATRGMPPGSPATPIWLHIASYGGSLFSGLSLADQLSLIRSPVYTVVEGLSASAASLLALAGTRRYILPNSFILIHQLSAFASGTHEQFKDEIDIQAKLMNRLVEFYVQRTNLPDRKVRKMLQRDTWLDAETSMELGFVDEILSQWPPQTGTAQNDA
jgi:ATP-dependent Clp endopeptidase proteolytic subunit ClpP